MREQIKSRKRLFLIILLGLTLCGLGFGYRTILTGAGEFLAPEEIQIADVVILEGTELLREKPVEIGMNLLSSGKANSMIVVVHQNPKDGQIFGLASYMEFIAKDLAALGLRKNQFRIIEVPATHPVTLTEAQIVLTSLSRSNVRSAILLAEGFHTRRSFWAYKQQGTLLGIQIFPCPYFASYQKEVWWRSSDGRYKFIEESLKYFYYIVKGYIPARSLLGARAGSTIYG